jgi:hypothetical protein
MRDFDSLFAPGYRLVSALFLRLLGLIYLVAFISLGTQVQASSAISRYRPCSG